MLLDISKNMVKKNKSSKKCWLEYMRILIQFSKEGLYPELTLKKELARAMQCISQKKHVQFL